MSVHHVFVTELVRINLRVSFFVEVLILADTSLFGPLAGMSIIEYNNFPLFPFRLDCSTYC